MRQRNEKRMKEEHIEYDFDCAATTIVNYLKTIDYVGYSSYKV